MTDSSQPTVIQVITLDHGVDKTLSNALSDTAEGMRLQLPPQLKKVFFEKLGLLLDYAWQEGYRKTVLLCDPRIRQALHRFIEKQFPRVPVLSYAEIASGFQIDVIGTITW